MNSPVVKVTVRSGISGQSSNSLSSSAPAGESSSAEFTNLRDADVHITRQALKLTQKGRRLWLTISVAFENSLEWTFPYVAERSGRIPVVDLAVGSIKDVGLAEYVRVTLDQATTCKTQSGVTKARADLAKRVLDECAVPATAGNSERTAERQLSSGMVERLQALTRPKDEPSAPAPDVGSGQIEI